MTPVATTHETNVTYYTDPTAPYGIDTWWAWSCTCGEGGDGYGHTLAHDLAYTHERRMDPTCACANPTITLTSSRFGAQVTAHATCDCGFSTYTDVDYGLCQYHSDAIGHATARSRVLLSEHRCYPLAGHDHTHPVATVIA